MVESVKTASDVYSPVAGEVTDGNPKLASEPEAVNCDPYENWLMRVRMVPDALAAAQYTKILEAQGGSSSSGKFGAPRKF